MISGQRFKDKYAEFESDGEEVVRRKMDQGRYSGRNLTAATSWLKMSDRERQRREKRIAEIRSWIAIGISVAALIVSVLVALFK